MVNVFYQIPYWLKNLTGLILTVWLESVKNVKISPPLKFPAIRYIFMKYICIALIALCLCKPVPVMLKNLPDNPSRGSQNLHLLFCKMFSVVFKLICLVIHLIICLIIYGIMYSYVHKKYLIALRSTYIGIKSLTDCY